MKGVQKVLSGGRITLTEKIMKTLRIEVGDYVIVTYSKDYAEIHPVTIQPRKSR